MPDDFDSDPTQGSRENLETAATFLRLLDPNATEFEFEFRTFDDIVACHELHAALGRTVEQVDIMDTIEQDTAPANVIVAGAKWIADWENAVAIRQRLDQLYQYRRR